MNESSGETGAPSDNKRFISFKYFLEQIRPGVETEVDDLWKTAHNASRLGVSNSSSKHLQTPPLRLHCQRCEGERTFRSIGSESFPDSSKGADTSLTYRCGDCGVELKKFSMSVEFGASSGGTATKYGEIPSFGVPVPNRILRLFGKDSNLFLKGRQCENQGLGVGAFAYYRRVVENHKNDIIDELVRVCETIGELDVLATELTQAKAKHSFSESVEAIKTALPASLLIKGHNPLVALHRALSVGLHSESDEDCLASAAAVRLVLTELINRMQLLRQDDRELTAAVKLLLSKQSKT